MNFTYQIENKNEFLILFLNGNLTADNQYNNILDDFEDYMQEKDYKFCVIDTSKVDYLGSSGINAMIKVLTFFRNKEGEVLLLTPSKRVEELLIITKLRAIFTIVENLEEAESYFKKA
jgi:anti-sigma B factor antagonist